MAVGCLLRLVAEDTAAQSLEADPLAPVWGAMVATVAVRRNSEESSWIRRLTRIPKGDGDQSMPVQAWWPCPRVGAARQGDPCDMANAGLREAQSPVMQVFIHRKSTCETGAALCVGLFRWLAQLPQRWAMLSESIKGDEW